MKYFLFSFCFLLCISGITAKKNKNHGLLTEWFDNDYHGLIIALEPGDLIECEIIEYSGYVMHWMVYYSKVGSKHYIIHRTGNISASKSDGGEEGIREDYLELQTQNRKCRINNSRDHKKIPHSSDEIVDRAKQMTMIDEKTTEAQKREIREYCLFTKNCEHFANWCRYGEAISYQATQLLAKAMKSSATSSATLAIGAYEYCSVDKSQCMTWANYIGNVIGLF